MSKTIDSKLYDRAVVWSARPGVSSAAEQEIDDLWEQIHSGVDPTDPAQFGTFLSRRIAELHRETDPADRSTQLCGTGNHMCNCLQGSIPEELQPQRGRFDSQQLTPSMARRYVRRNSQCHAVRKALSEWDSKRSTMRQQLRKVIALAKHDIAEGTAQDLDTDNVPTGRA